MCFHGALGDVQIASDFRIATALKQQIDDLPLPLSHFSKLLFHALTSRDALGAPQVANRPSGPMRSPRFGSCVSAPCIRSANPPLPGYQSVKIHRACHFSLKNQRVFVAKHCVGQALACSKSWFCSDSKVNNLGQISGVPAAAGMNYTKVHSAESDPPPSPGRPVTI